MTTVSYPLGRPPAAAKRGGDCRARDLNQARNVHGGHRFAATTHCRINNGLLRLTVGASGAAPSLTVEARRGRVFVSDAVTDVVDDVLGGSIGTPQWLSLGTLTIDSPSVAALLTAARLVRINPEAVTVRLVAPLMADAFVTLRRGERQFRIQHGSTRSPTVSTIRRVRWTATPSPAGVATPLRVEEQIAATGLDGLFRFIASHDPVSATAGTFSLASLAATTSATTCAGVSLSSPLDRPFEMHQQQADASRPRLAVEEA